MGIFFNRNSDNENEKSQSNFGSSKGKVIAFLNQKGGVGKTTVAFNTAFALRAQGKRVLCLDLDPQANLTYLFGLEDVEGYSLYNLLLNSIRELKGLHTSCLVSDLLVQKDGVDLIPSSGDLSGFELTVAGISVPRQLILKKFIEKNGLTHLYDYIIIDCPPTLGLLVINSLCASDGVIVPFRPDDFSRKGLNAFYEVLENIDDMGVVKVPEILVHVPNLVDSRRKQEQDDLANIVNQLGSDSKVMGPILNKSQLVKALGQKKSVFDYTSKEFLPLQESFSEIANIIEEWAQ